MTRRLVPTVLLTAAALVATSDDLAAQACKTTRVSVGTGGATVAPTSNTWGGAISGDGRFVQFGILESDPPDLEYHVWLRDEATDVTQQLDVTTAGVPGDDLADPGDLSHDGRYAVFTSKARNLVPGKTLSTNDVFVRDVVLGVTTPVTLDVNGQPSDGDSWHPVVSAGGEVVAFDSNATLLVPGDSNGSFDVFVYERATGAVSRVSVSSSGAEANGGSSAGDISADGRFVAFGSWATNLAPNDTNGEWDVFVHDRATGATTLISRTPTGASASGHSSNPTLSADGRYVVYDSTAPDLVAGDTNGVWDVFRHDRLLGTTTRISVDALGQQLDQESYAGPQSADGSKVLISSLSDALVPGDTNQDFDAFLLDLDADTIELVSVGSTGVQGPNGSASFGRGLSADGRLATFESSGGFPSEPGKTGGMFLRGCPQLVARYGESKPNSQGCRPRVTWDGSPSASAGSGFVIRTHDLINQVTGIFVYADQPQVPTIPRYLWVQPPVTRVVLGSSGGSAAGVDCTGGLELDFNAWIAQGGDPSLVPGATVYGQFWSRDPGFAGPNAYGMSDAVDLTIAP